MGKLSKLKIVLRVFVIATLLLSPFSINAMNGTLRGVASSLKDAQFEQLNFIINEDDPIQTDAKIIPNFDAAGVGDVVSAGDSRYVYYPNCLDYFGTLLSVRVEIKVLSGNANIDFVTNDTTYGYKNQLLYGNDYGNKAEITIYFYDEDGNDFNYSGLYGIVDPDLGNYLFDTTAEGMKLYYKDTGRLDDENIKMADNINVTDTGLYPVDTTKNYGMIGGKLDEGIVFIQLDGVTSFTFTAESYGDWIVVPSLYSLKYKVEYVLNDSAGFPADNSNNESFVTYAPGINKTIANPKRPGYTFDGWTRTDVDEPGDQKNNSIVPTDTGDKTFVAKWKAIEYKLQYNPNNDSFPGTAEGTMADQTATAGDNTLNPNLYTADGYKWIGWSLEEGVVNPVYGDKGTHKVKPEDIDGKVAGDTLATLYAQWAPIEYTVRYDKNAADATGSMADQTPLKYDTDYNLDPNAFTREGYTWVGWNVAPDNSGTPYTDKQGFTNLTNVDGGVVTMYAQWEPWKYYLDYDGNGGKGDMPMQTFNYFSELMNSKANEFTRDGYRFTGFKYIYNGNARIIYDPKDFKALLLELGPGSKITLVAQWEKIPSSYTAPVTGVE